MSVVGLWNMYDSATRTNNDLEGWHLRFNNIVRTHHPNIWELLVAISDEQDATDVTLQQIAAGQRVQRRNRTYEQIERRLARLKRRYIRAGDIDIIEYINGVAYNLSAY